MNGSEGWEGGVGGALGAEADWAVVVVVMLGGPSNSSMQRSKQL